MPKLNFTLLLLLFLLFFLMNSKKISRKHLDYGDWAWKCKCFVSNEIGECTKLHCDVDKDQTVSCFSIYSTVELPSGSHKHLKDLIFNEEIVTLDEKLQRRIDRFIGFLHLDENVQGDFLNITTLNNQNETKFILITSKHLIFKDADNAVFAENLTLSDSIIESSGKQANIVSIKKVSFKGVAAPLTESGTALIDGYWASNYAFYENHRKAHLAFWGYRTGAKLFGERVSGRNEKGILKYASFLMQVKKWMGLD